jgi:hypothetical protein
MNSIIHYNYAALYSDLLEPFRSEAFGPRLATILLLLAVVVLIGFWCFALQSDVALSLPSQERGLKHREPVRRRERRVEAEVEEPAGRSLSGNAGSKHSEGRRGSLQQITCGRALP